TLASMSSWQVDREIERAHEYGKNFIPILGGVSHVEFQNRKRGWRMAMGTVTSLPIPAEGASKIVPRIVAGLKRLGFGDDAGPVADKVDQFTSKPESARQVTQEPPTTEGNSQSVPGRQKPDRAFLFHLGKQKRIILY